MSLILQNFTLPHSSQLAPHDVQCMLLRALAIRLAKRHATRIKYIQKNARLLTISNIFSTILTSSERLTIDRLNTSAIEQG